MGLMMKLAPYLALIAIGLAFVIRFIKPILFFGFVWFVAEIVYRLTY